MKNNNDNSVIVKLRSRSRSGEGQEGQSQAKSSSENSKLKDLDLSSTLFLVFTHPSLFLKTGLFLRTFIQLGGLLGQELGLGPGLDNWLCPNVDLVCVTLPRFRR